MFGITDIYAYLLGALLIILLPGPNSLYCLSVSASQGKQAGLWAMLGILVGDTILILATVLGVGTLLKLYPSVFFAIKLVGGSYLAYLGGRLLLGAWTTFKNRELLKDKPLKLTAQATQNYFYRSLTLSLTNPKAILFFLSFFVGFVNPSYAYPLLSFFILALILQFFSFSYLMLLVVSGKTLADNFGGKPWLMIMGMLIVGVLFVGFGVNLWMSEI